jgi:hypothetical protein
LVITARDSLNSSESLHWPVSDVLRCTLYSSCCWRPAGSRHAELAVMHRAALSLSRHRPLLFFSFWALLDIIIARVKARQGNDQTNSIFFSPDLKKQKTKWKMGMTLIVFKAGRQISLKFLLRLYNQKDADTMMGTWHIWAGRSWRRTISTCFDSLWNSCGRFPFCSFFLFPLLRNVG